MRFALSAFWTFLFGLLAIAMVFRLTEPVDTAIRAAIHALASSDATDLALLFSFIGSNPVWIASTVVVGAGLWLHARRREALALAMTMAGAALVETGLKTAFQRVRPETFFGVAPDTFSFPSGHALFAICFYGALAIILGQKLRSRAPRCFVWVGGSLLALCIGFSRIYLGVHYPSDVLAGYFAGAAWLTLLHGLGAFQPAFGNRPLR